jgi:hypothetical protein
MSHKFESGDEFKIDPKYLGHRCNAKNKTYIIHHISKHGYGVLVYYRDTRTNIKCTCSQCRPTNPWGSAPVKDEMGNVLKQVHIGNIILIQSKIQRNRDISLKFLLGKSV